MIRLYSMKGICATAVHIALEWSDLDYEVDILNQGDQHRIGYLKVNPIGLVPALELANGVVRTEVVALLLYVDALAERRFGMSSDPDDLADLAQALSFLSNEVHSAFGPHFQPSRFHPDQSEHSTLRAYAYARIERLFSLIDGRFAGPFLFGERRSVADALLLVALRWLRKTPIGAEKFESLSTFLTLMENDEAIKIVLKQYG